MAPVGERLRDPVVWSDASQIVKTVAAAVIAWVIARDVLGIAQPFLAPWAALLTVHATVYRTLARGAQQVGATVLGVLLAFAAGAALGVNAASLGIVLLVGHAGGRHPQPARGVHDRGGHGARGAADGLRGRLPGAVRAAARHGDRDRRRARDQPPGLASAARPRRGAPRRPDRRPDRRAAHRHGRAAARGWRGGRRRGVGRAHARHRARGGRRVGDGPPGARERTAEPAPRRGRPRARVRRLRSAADAVRAGDGRGSQHGAHDGRLHGLAAALEPRVPGDLHRPARAHGQGDHGAPTPRRSSRCARTSRRRRARCRAATRAC